MSRFLILIAALAAFASGPSGAEPRVVLAELGSDGAALYDADDEVRLSVALTQAVPWSIRFEAVPPRLIVEFSDVVWNREPRTASTSVERIEVGRSAADRSELVAYLREPLSVASAEMKVSADGALLDVRLVPTTADVFRADATAPVVVEGRRAVVAIDPGHGGVDPGAEAGDLDEADLVLEFSRRLETELLETGLFEVVLTREEDRFVSLDDRLTRAREAKAEMFLSIHADALAGANASGMVVYSLSPEAEDRATRRLTERHDPDDILSDVDLTHAGDDVTEALVSLARRNNAPRAAALSSALIGSFRASGLTLNSRPERTGDFAVLKAADVPSVLVELGFLSTEEDVERLTSEEWQNEASRAIRDALLLWTEEDRLR